MGRGGSGSQEACHMQRKSQKLKLYYLDKIHLYQPNHDYKDERKNKHITKFLIDNIIFNLYFFIDVLNDSRSI